MIPKGCTGRASRPVLRKYVLFFMLLPFIFSLLVFAGCASVRKKDPSVGGQKMLEPQAIVRFIDLPVPAGFKLLSEESYVFEGAGVRVGALKYQGKANADEIVSFYKEQMPMYNWALLNIIEYGSRLLNFDREKESCIINILPRGSKVIISISLGPKSQAQTRQNRTQK